MSQDEQELEMILKQLRSWWGRKSKYILQLEETNRQNQRTIQDMDQRIRDLQNLVNNLENSIATLKSQNSQLASDNTKALSQLATSRRDPSTVFTPGATIQPIQLEREYGDFVEQRMPNVVTHLLRHFKETIPNFDQLPPNPVRNLFQRKVSYYIFHEEYISQESRKISSYIMTDLRKDLKLPELSLLVEPAKSRRNLTQDLEALILKGQSIANAIRRSGGKLLFYEEGATFSDEYHESISGPDTDAVIQDTITPAYVVDSTRMVERPYLKPLRVARVITTHSTGTSSDSARLTGEGNQMT